MTYIFVLIWPNDFADGVVVKSLSQFSYVILMIIDRKMPLEFIFKRHLWLYGLLSPTSVTGIHALAELYYIKKFTLFFFYTYPN